MTLSGFHEFPKVELHCHLDGSLPLATIRQLADMAGIDLPTDEAELKALVTAPDHVESLNDYLKTFDFVRPLLQTKEALRLAAHDVAVASAQENVLYMEIRFAPELSMDQGLSAYEVVEAVLTGFSDAMAEQDIVVKALVCGLKQTADEQSLPIFQAVRELQEHGLAGFDFAGNEVDYPTEEIAELIRETQALGLPMTFHAGECGCAANIAYGMDLGLKRFGHATALYKEPDLIERVVAEGATLEMCLTSNLQTKAVPSIEDFPYPQLYQAGANITINTDNRTVSDTNLTKEYELFHKTYGTASADFLRFNENALQAAFISPAEKALLLQKIRQNYQPFL